MLLEKLKIPFTTAKPEIDETPLQGETVKDMVDRLTLAKAEKIATQQSDKLIIASDQSAAHDGKSIGKPYSYENAFKQLSAFSGKSVTFHTGLVLIDQINQKTYQTQDLTVVHFRSLSETDIRNYLLLETPYECAGSFKSEGLGITLFEKIDSTDPNALIGLPLIQLTSFLKSTGIQLPYLEANI